MNFKKFTGLAVKSYLAISLALFGAPLWAADNDCDDVLRLGTIRIIRDGQFTRDRGFDEAAHIFGRRYRRDVLRLRAGQRWFDGGAGDAFVGQVYRGLTPFRERLSSGIAALEIELHGSKIRRPEGKPTHPGNISLKKKLDQISITDRADYVGLTYGASAWVPRSSQNGRYRLFVGKYFSEVSNEDIGATDLITDLFGLIPYSVDPDTVLARYLTLSRREGVIYIADGGPRSQFLSESTVKKRDGRIVSFLDWMREIPGIRVQHRPQSEDTVLSTLLMREIRTVSSARITKIQAFTAKNNIRFPKLKMVGKLSDADRFETKEFIETMENHVVIPLEP